MKRKASTTTLTVVLMFLMFFLVVRQITLPPISKSSSRNSTVQGKQTQMKPYWIPGKTTEPTSAPTQPITCDRSHYRYDICNLNGPTVVDPTISTLFLLDPNDSLPPRKQLVRPYPRKWENGTMSYVKQLTLLKSPVINYTHCDHQHDAPALVFSAGGYTGNLFHDFNDGFIPLFVTLRSVFPDQYPVLVIANCGGWWLSKYAELLKKFTPHAIINLDTNTSTHCFPSATIGLISHGYMTIDPNLLPNSDSFLSFRSLLGNAYVHVDNHFPRASSLRPRLVLVVRTGDVGRTILNQDEVTKVAEQIGFEVAMFEPNKYTSMPEAYGLINTSHAMLGVHGAALTHSLFLRPGSVLIQVVPIGIDWLAETCFGKPARDMGLEYMEYKIGVEESSLLEMYGKDHLVLRNPRAFVKEDFSKTKNVYLKKQHVRLDLERVRKYLKKAHKKALRFMNRDSQI